jgi:hypothetical protein
MFVWKNELCEFDTSTLRSPCENTSALAVVPTCAVPAPIVWVTYTGLPQRESLNPET